MRTIPILLATAMVAAPTLAAAPAKMVTKMNGAAEIPGPGDPDGSGTATVTVNAAKGEVCYTLSVDGIDAATMAHIHKGATGVAGPPVVTLDAPATGTSEGCKATDAAVVAALIANPADYYVNVHNAAFPKGAVRGQLGN